MKRVLFIALLFSVVAIISQSCKKDDTEMKNKDKKSLKSTLRTGDVDAVEVKIIKFVERMNLVRENPNYPGSENWNYSQDSTVWYIEAALNYTYAGEWLYEGPEEHSDMYNIDSSFTQVAENSSGNEYNIVSLQVSYDEFASELLTQYNEIQSESKFFIVSNIIDKGIQNSELDLKQVSIIGRTVAIPSLDNWYWGFDHGKCDGTQAPKDATDIIEWKKSLFAQNPAPAGYSHYYTNVAYIYIMPNDVPTASNPFGFFSKELFMGPDNTCMNAAMINYYYNYFITFDTRFTPSGYSHIFSDLDWGVVLSGGTGYHHTDLYYGDIHFTSRYIKFTE